MCCNPRKIPDVGYVSCRECWQCRERKVDDWVGRNIAESQTAKAAHVVTLTYGRDRTTGGIDHLRAAVLTYSDVQKYLKYLRVDGYPVRYFVTGEYGSKKGRAHWHIILYWQGAVPEHELRRNFMQKHWPHGWSYWDKMSPEAVRYACKYLVKVAGEEEGQIFGPMPSKKPPLGDAFFRQLARRYVKAGIAPQDLFYSFPEVRRVPVGTVGRTARQLLEAAKPIPFMLRGKSAENFCTYFVDAWREAYDDEPPRSEVIWSFLNKRLESYVERVSIPRFEKFIRLARPSVPPPGGSEPVRDEVLNTWVSVVDGQRLFWSYDMEGEIGWQEKIGFDPRKKEARERAYEVRRQAYQIATRGG